jgi:hypothetical protein
MEKINEINEGWLIVNQPNNSCINKITINFFLFKYVTHSTKKLIKSTKKR